MPKKIFKEEFRIMIAELVKNGGNKAEIARRYNVSISNIQYWLKIYNNYVSPPLKLTCGVESIMTKEIEIKKLKAKIKDLEKENSKLKQDLIDEEVKNEFLEKHMPSYIECWTKERKRIMKTKEYKHHAFSFIFQMRKFEKFTISYLSRLLCVSRSKYYAWVERFGIKEVDDIPEFKSKIPENTLDLMKECKRTFGESGSRQMRDAIYAMHGVRISDRTIAQFKRDNRGHFKYIGRRKTSKAVGVYSLQKNVREDKIGNDFSTTGMGQKIGLDGTKIEVWINKKLTNILCEMAYDWHLGNVVGFNVGKSENGEIVLKTLQDAFEYLEKNNYANCIIQSDRGPANCSQIVRDYEQSQNRFVMSMSEVGFKHNPNTESLNGWYKDLFLASCGNIFTSLEDFENVFRNFIEKRNNLKLLIYTKKREQQLRM